MTPLMLAAWGGRPNVVRLLIDNMADVNAKNNDGNTALMEAAENHQDGGRREHADIMGMLKAAGARE
ncbi:hypothetical protein HGB07_04585 [Candidatus Roizmanbacteria bacterium]|nr:hypothetical protein [Candidatus Roizmanbacteria bacterium]